MLERSVIELGLGEGFGARQEGDFRTRPSLILADHLQRAIGHAMGEADFVQLAIAPNPQIELH